MNYENLEDTTLAVLFLATTPGSVYSPLRFPGPRQQKPSTPH